MSKVYYRYFTDNSKYGERKTPYLDSLAYTVQEFLYTKDKAKQEIKYKEKIYDEYIEKTYTERKTRSFDCEMDGRIQLYDFMTMTLHLINALASDYAKAEMKEYLADLKQYNKYDSRNEICHTNNNGIIIVNTSKEIIFSLLWTAWIYMKVFVDLNSISAKPLETRVDLLYDAMKENYPSSEENLNKHPLIAHAPAAMTLMCQHIQAKAKKQKSKASQNSEEEHEEDNSKFQARIKELEAELEKKNNDIEAYETQSKGVSASKHALLLTTLCHHLGGLPQNGRQSLSNILQKLYGYTESTADKALKQKVTQKDADALAKLFQGISPRVQNLIKEMPNTLEELNKERLRKLNEQNNQKK